MINKKLIFISHLNLELLLYSLSNLQYQDISVDIIIIDKNTEFEVDKLIKVLVYVLQTNCIFNIKLYTNNRIIFKYIKNIRNAYGLEDRLVIMPLQTLNYTNDGNLVDLAKYEEILVIKNDQNLKYYNPRIFIPILTI